MACPATWMRGLGTDVQCLPGLRSGIAALQARANLPALQRAHIDACQCTRRLQPRAIAMGLLDVLSNQLAILQGYHSSPPGWKIASIFLTAPATP